MKLLYDTNQFFLGIVKFYDKKKRFGYISSNNLGMNRDAYHQDFYINNESFDNGIADAGRVVVFQIAQFGEEDGMKGRVQCRAINVRGFSKTDEDYQLLLSYYGSHEIVRVKETSHNLFKLIAVPRSIILQKVLSVIGQSNTRTTEETLDAIKHVVGFYKQESFRLNYTYTEFIFDRDFNRNSKDSWSSFINQLTDDEIKAFVKAYPSIIKYVLRREVLISSFNSVLEDSINDDSKLWYLNKIINSCSPEMQELLVPLFHSKVDERFKLILSKVEDQTISSEKEFINESAVFLLINNARYYAQHQDAIYRLRKRQFLSDIKKLQDEEDCSLLSTVQKEYDSLSDEDKVENEGLLIEARKGILSGLLSSVEAALDQPEEVMRLLERNFETKTKPYITAEDVLSFTNHIQALLPSVKSLYVLDRLSTLSWISRDSCIELAKGLISDWDFEAMKTHLADISSYFGGKGSYKSFLVEKAIKLTQQQLEANSFSLEQDLEATGFYEHSIIWSIHSLISKTGFLPVWREFVYSFDDASTFLLFRKGVIESVPGKTIAWVVKNLSLDDFVGNPKEWYTVPKLESQDYFKLFRNAKDNLVEIVLPVLIERSSSPDYLPLCFCLAELMAYNRPGDDADYMEKKQWEQRFRDSLKEKVRICPIESRIKNVIWATFFETNGVSSELKESFFLYPPYYQIRIVRKLFHLITQDKLRLSVKETISLLGGEHHPLCLPLEIAFKYLALREDFPDQTLHNEDMISILKGRPDSDQWYKLVGLMTSCEGRVRVAWKGIGNNTPRFQRESSSLYNGILIQKNSQLILQLNNKMVDASGRASRYNNKRLNSIREYIQISFIATQYSCVNTGPVSEYVFSDSLEKELIILCDSYSIYSDYLSLRQQSLFELKNEGGDYVFCECRLADLIDKKAHRLFYWCDNKPCFRIRHLRFRPSSEWEHYTLLDFMRIAKIPIDYTNRSGKTTKFGYYILLSSFLYRFIEFYEHMKCRGCNQLMSPADVSNFGAYAATQFKCRNGDCAEEGKIVYLNHCFNRSVCGATIDSRDSKQCPNRQYICPKCGGCCSTENAKRKIEQLKYTGGTISHWLLNIASLGLGHWENNEVYCYKCGKRLPPGQLRCDDCGVEYTRKQQAASSF